MIAPATQIEKHRKSEKSKPGKLTKIATVAALAVIVGLVGETVRWTIVYRMPRTAPILLDLRNESGSGSTLMICAALANNPHGYPGHCYIVWDRLMPEKLEYADSDGFVPASYSEVVPSLFSDVHGIMADHADIGNLRNLDYVAVRIDQKRYEQARAVRRRYVTNQTFHTGVRDCVAYVNDIAQIAGMKTPPREFVYPLDYVEQLKRLNAYRAEVLPKPRLKEQ